MNNDKLSSYLLGLLAKHMDYEEACLLVRALSPEELDQHLEWAAEKMAEKMKENAS